jgi:putative two-component system response regulator
MYQVEILLAALTIIVGLALAYSTLKHYASQLEQTVRERTAEVFQLKTAVLDSVADLVEFRDQLTGGHNERTQRYLQILLEELTRSGDYKEEISKWNIDFFLPSAQLHDVGKIAIPDEILNKPGQLSEAERKTMQNHVTVGIDALRKITSNTAQRVTKEHAFLWHALAIAGAHHEKWDGTGYPFGLKGEKIPLEGRLMAIADVYDALISVRPYKKAFTHEEACQIIEKESGTHFDPVLVDAFCRVQGKFSRVVEENRSVYLNVEKLAAE